MMRYLSVLYFKIGIFKYNFIIRLIYIYTYIHVCARACVCVCAYCKINFGSDLILSVM